jgi:hypothetical protein
MKRKKRRKKRKKRSGRCDHSAENLNGGDKYVREEEKAR